MTDHTDVVRNWRGKYPPVAILENTRRALSASVHSAKREGKIDEQLLIDLVYAYKTAMHMENQLRKLRGLGQIKHYPMWVAEFRTILKERDSS